MEGVYTSRSGAWYTRQTFVDSLLLFLYLLQAEFRYWGLQSRIERFIHDYGLRRVMLRAHRQAWTWQDEWVGLTMADIRILELETQKILKRKLGRSISEQDGLALEEEEEEEDNEPKEQQQQQQQQQQQDIMESIKNPQRRQTGSKR